LVPIAIMLFKKGRRPKPMFFAGVMIVAGAWFKRYLIVTPTLLHPFLPMHDAPQKFMHYFPSWQEWAIAIGSLAGALLLITFFARLFPIIPIAETLHEKEIASSGEDSIPEAKSVTINYSEHATV
jgi:Ni/Fe-hydrogenase subunit HybB-like protein